MPSIKPNATIAQVQKFCQDVYALRNDRHFRTWGMVSNVLRFLMRGLKGIRKEDRQKIKKNLLIAMSWFLSIMNQMHIQLEGHIWQRFPYLCSYCGRCPCQCRALKINRRRKVIINNKLRPKTLRGFQSMFNDLY